MKWFWKVVIIVIAVAFSLWVYSKTKAIGSFSLLILMFPAVAEYFEDREGDGKDG